MGPGTSADGRRRGGVKPVREGVWRVDVELPRVEGEPRRRVSKTIAGSLADAEQSLADLGREVAQSAPRRRTAKSGGGRSARPRNSGGISELARDRWLVGVEGPADPVTGKRRRYTRVVRGSRELAEIALARLKLEIRRRSPSRLLRFGWLALRCRRGSTLHATRSLLSSTKPATTPIGRRWIRQRGAGAPLGLHRFDPSPAGLATELRNDHGRRLLQCRFCWQQPVPFSALLVDSRGLTDAPLGLLHQPSGTALAVAVAK